MRISRGKRNGKASVFAEFVQHRKKTCRNYGAAGLILLGGMLATFAVRAADNLPASVSGALRAAGIEQNDVSFEVWGVGEEYPRLTWRSRVPRNPASVMKLLTTGLALEQWGPARTWQTVVRRSPVEGKAVTLAVVGSGDPDLTLARWEGLWRQVYQQGMTHVADLLLDGAQSEGVTDAFDGQGFRAYNVIPTFLQVDQQTQWLWVRPGKQGGDPVEIWSDFPFPRQQWVNHVVTRAGPCPSLWREDLHYRIHASGASQILAYRPSAELDRGLVVEWAGTVSQACGPHVWGLSLLTNEGYLAATFETLWHELGGDWEGGVHSASADAAWTEVALTESRPLEEILMDMNRNSNNVMARMLLRDLVQDSAVATAGSSSCDSQCVVRAMLRQRGLDFPELVLDNGAGLSRRSSISVDSLVRWLKWMQENSRYGREFAVTLPEAGIEGTVKQGLEELRGKRFRLKSGTLNGVKGVAGYGRDAEGHEVVLALLVNGAHAERAGAVERALLRWISSESKMPQPGSRLAE